MEENKNSMNQNHHREKYHNRASLAMITLPGAWIVFDLFAFWMGEKTLAIGATIFTIALILFFVFLQIRGKQAEKRYEGSGGDGINEGGSAHV